MEAVRSSSDPTVITDLSLAHLDGAVQEYQMLLLDIFLLMFYSYFFY